MILLIVFIDVYPLFWMITASFKAPGEFVTKPAYALNAGFYLKNYVEAWTRGKMALFFKNSLICTVISLFLIIILTLTSSFALTKMRWKGRTFFDQIFCIRYHVPVATSLIPLFSDFPENALSIPVPACSGLYGFRHFFLHLPASKLYESSAG